MITTLACRCGFREEVHAEVTRLDCTECRAPGGLVAITPRWTPPAGAGRPLTPAESERIAGVNRRRRVPA